MSGHNKQGLLKASILFITLLGVAYLLKVTALDEVFDRAWAERFFHDKDLRARLLFLGFAAVFTGVGLPRHIVCFLGGYVFGLFWGTFLGLTGTVIGCIAAFYYARLLGRDFISRKYPKRIKKIDSAWSANPFTVTLIIRFLPFGSNLLTNLIGGVSSVPAIGFFLGTYLGHLPQSLIFALMGSGIRVEPVWRIGLSILLFVLSTALGFYLYKRYKSTHALTGEESGDL